MRHSAWYNSRNPYSWDNIYNQYVRPWGESVLGYTQMKNNQASAKATMEYDQYIKAGNERALGDWHKNVPNRQIRYPEFSYSGQIARANTSIATAGFSYDNAFANYQGNLHSRSLGLYGVPGRVYRSM